MSENLNRRSLNEATLKSTMSRRGVATAAIASMGLLGNVNQARASDMEIDSSLPDTTKSMLYPNTVNRKGLNRFKELTQDISKYSPEEQRNI